MAGLYGDGKIALSTIVPSGTIGEQFLENAAGWHAMPSLVLRDAELSEVIIWEGDRVVISLRITDRAWSPVTGLDVSARLNDTEVTVTESGSGIYTVTLDESWTRGRPGMLTLIVHASKSGYDTLSVELPNFMFIRPLSWTVILIIGAGLVTVVAIYIYIRYKRRQSPDSSLSKDERRRRETEESKLDPKELFGID